jgi:membrane-bound lytic murein transglycosylase D
MRRSDTLVTVADRFGVTVEQLRVWNKLSSGRAAPGRSLYVAEPIRLAPMGRSARTKRGRSGAGEASAHSVHRGATAHGATSGKSHTAANGAAKKKKRK